MAMGAASWLDPQGQWDWPKAAAVSPELPRKPGVSAWSSINGELFTQDE